jgi:uncharacterized protein (DUF1810 family)
LDTILGTLENFGRGGDVEPAYNLERFVEAQNASATYEQAVLELQAERKQSHWMWFVFPQIAGLGTSSVSRRFAVSGLDEARAYLAHPVLGPRLRTCTHVLLQTGTRNAETIFGPLDAQKLRSSMTLFLRADAEESLFQEVLDRYFDGAPDPATDELL